jgi:hypothetical protein
LEKTTADYNRRANKRWLFMIIITIANVLTATGYSIAGILNPSYMLPQGIIIGESTLIFALYAGARTIPLTIITLIAILKKCKASIITLGFLAGCVQFIDGFIGVYQRDVFKSGGPFLLSVIQIIAIYGVIKSNK